jgi:hypothetical protein
MIYEVDISGWWLIDVAQSAPFYTSWPGPVSTQRKTCLQICHQFTTDNLLVGKPRKRHAAIYCTRPWR